jgi:hypothetical protein
MFHIFSIYLYCFFFFRFITHSGGRPNTRPFLVFLRILRKHDMKIIKAWTTTGIGIVRNSRRHRNHHNTTWSVYASWLYSCIICIAHDPVKSAKQPTPSCCCLGATTSYYYYSLLASSSSVGWLANYLIIANDKLAKVDMTQQEYYYCCSCLLLLAIIFSSR